ncbi:MAG TPA: relaxase/mobilization nuclease domain-containing protein [Steroidobacteraceae bacterium]|nr:relaxase/mobilization nuclease domain-containing protein [Steroidobacteraceae bacterium]
MLDIRSFARRGPGHRPLTPALVEQLARTVGRAPEVMVKVSGGAKSLKGAIAHLSYIDRKGKLELETDEGSKLQGDAAARALVSEWDLEASRAHARFPYRGQGGRRPTKLLHNVILSMPKGTPPDKLLAASGVFAREQFGLQHRYALVLHTDQDHPHVHLVVKAVSEEGRRLNIRKATLREWRRQFAHHLREQGVPANATERAVRGCSQSTFKDGVYRASQRGESLYLRERLARLVEVERHGVLEPSPGKAKLLETRRAVVAGWHAAAEALADAGQGALAQKIWGFIGGMQPPLTTDEQLSRSGFDRPRIRERERQPERSR